MPRLVKSTDGGHNWTVIDGQVATQKLGVRSYAVDPTDPNTIYALFGGVLLPFQVAVPNDVLPVFGFKQELFKTTDDGATWHLVLNNIPFGSQVQLASGNPQIIYVGGTFGPLPLLRGETEPADPIPVASSFHLQVSKDGGASWQLVAIPSDMLSIQNWYVSPGGQVYASPTIPFNGQPTAVAGTLPYRCTYTNAESSKCRTSSTTKLALWRTYLGSTGSPFANHPALRPCLQQLERRNQTPGRWFHAAGHTRAGQ